MCILLKYKYTKVLTITDLNFHPLTTKKRIHSRFIPSALLPPPPFALPSRPVSPLSSSCSWWGAEIAGLDNDGWPIDCALLGLCVRLKNAGFFLNRSQLQYGTLCWNYRQKEIGQCRDGETKTTKHTNVRFCSVLQRPPLHYCLVRHCPVLQFQSPLCILGLGKRHKLPSESGVARLPDAFKRWKKN